MRRTLTAVLVFSLASIAFAASREKHFILTPQRLLSEQEQADLASRGLVVERAVGNGRFLVRIADDATIGSDDPRIASLEPLTASRKLHRSAIREIASGKPNVRLDVLFQDDVAFDDAKAAIEAAGGSLVEPLQTDFHLPRRITARIASTDVTTLASDDRVMLVYGQRRLIPKVDNSDEAALEHVTPLYSSPYNLSGQGVVLSYFELGEADASHPEFEGRLTTHVTGGSDGDKLHATHTGGTMIAAGLKPSAKGMAPQATLQEFDVNADNYLDLKQKLSDFNAVADNNSWGYILGWCIGTANCTDWTWGGNELYYGGYDSQITATIDKITRSNGVLFVHSAGNDATKTGPRSVPFSHAHLDSNGKVVSGYCYSSDGSGNDCPAPTCKAGNDADGQPFCEKTKHPEITEVLPAPWVSVGVTASAKNVMTVGAVNVIKNLATFSSRGPTRDGRVKPDIVTKGVDVYSTVPNNDYLSEQGTSMAAPQVTGVSALLVEMWRRTSGGANPSPQLLKTLMLATADDLGPPGPDYSYGFGLLNAQAAADTIVADAGQARRIVTKSVATGEEIDLPVSVNNTQNLRVVLGWADPEVINFPVDSGDPTDPLAAKTLVNDLDLSVVDPSGNTVLPYVLDMNHPSANATRGVNQVDNVEEVEIANATPGTYKIVVKGAAVPIASPQNFVVVANAEVGPAAQPCRDPFLNNATADNAYGNLVAQQIIRGRSCAATDVNYFKFLVDKPGAVSVTVTATDTPLRVTLTSSATQPVVVDIPAGQTQTVTTNYTGTTPVTFFARIEPTGTIGTTSRYTITPNFSTANHARRRSVRRH
ncbi:MAG TPA: S8 family serine peptidase [Thermoanaerobaculia bacterium]|nr:S8 family serine peptidase [Thermoanaerobaculia bacterium]